MTTEERDLEASRDVISCASERRTAGLKTLMMKEVISSIRVLKAASSGSICMEKSGDSQQVSSAITSILVYLHGRISSSSLRFESFNQVDQEEKDLANRSIVSELSSVFLYWHKEHQKKALPVQFWLLWFELGCSLDVLKCCRATEEVLEVSGEYLKVMTQSERPKNFPASRTHCTKEMQSAFSCQLWDAVVGKPLLGAPVKVVSAITGRLISVFLHWMNAAMREYETVFIANVATSFRAHLRASNAAFGEGSSIVDAVMAFMKAEMGPGNLLECGADLAVLVMILSALTSTQRAQEVENYLESLRIATVVELSRVPYSQVHSPVIVAAMALGLSALEDDILLHKRTVGNSMLLCQLALSRIASLPLLSSHLRPCDETTFSAYQEHVHQSLRASIHDPSWAAVGDLSLRITESSIEEMIGCFQSSLASQLALVAAMQSVLPSELFRQQYLNQLLGQVVASSREDSNTDDLLAPTEIVALVTRFYGAVAPILEMLSVGHLGRCFFALSRIEFAREMCVSPAMNASMNAVTEQLERTLEQSTPSPEVVFSALFRSLTMQASVASADVPREVDIVAGCQALAVGFVVQRKLRILLFQCGSLIDDALGVVFYGLYNVFEPVDAFAHRFLGVCLTHLGQFTPLFTVFPHYLQVTLEAYPANTSRSALTKTCGAIFGTLFYTEALTTPEACSESDVELSQRMVLWAIRKCSERSSELLTEESTETNEVAVNPRVKEEGTKRQSGDMEDPHASETDGLYLAGLVFELMKMVPIDILKASAMEIEQFLAHWNKNPSVLQNLKSALFARISQNCDAEKRAWLAAWYIELDKRHPVKTSKPTAELVAQPTPSRL